MAATEDIDELEYARLAEAERLSRERLALLAEEDTLLGSSFAGVTSLAQSLAWLVVARYAAAACFLHLLIDGKLETKAVAYAEATTETVLTRGHRSVGRMHPAILEVIRSGKAKLVGPAPTSRQAAEEPASTKVETGAPDSSATRLGVIALLPLVAHGSVLGVVEVESGTHSLTLEDLVFLAIFAHRAAVALDHARLYQAAEDARWQAELTAERVSRLQSVTSALSEATTTHQMAEIVVRHAIEAMGGHIACVAVRSEDGLALQSLAVAGLSETLASAYHRSPLADLSPMTTAFQTRTEVFHATADEWSSCYPPELDEGVLRGVIALSCLPLTLAEGHTVGVLFLGFDGPRRFVESERTFLRTLAQQLAQALDRARLYEAERRARLAAEEANHAKDDFLGMVSHELRTPLNAILGWSHLLRSREHDVAKYAHGLEVIERNARAQMRIVEDILDVARIVTGKLKLDVRPTDLRDVVQAAVDVVRSAADAKGVTLTVEHTGEIPIVAGDSDRLQQVMWNLLSNAIRFTKRGGRVDIATEVSGVDVSVAVTDDGAGIDPSIMPFIFDRFRQGDVSATRRHGGLGLGLAIVRHLAELHGGTIQAESRGLGLGARFVVHLPIDATMRQRSSLLRESDGVTPRSVPQLKNLRVLLVDDDGDARDVLIEVLGAQGIIVAGVESADAAMRVVESFQPDVLVTDIGMPGEDGFTLLARVRALRSSQRSVPAIALTAYARDVDVRRAIHAGFHAHLAKPVTSSDLFGAIVSAHTAPRPRPRPHPRPVAASRGGARQTGRTAKHKKQGSPA